MKFEQFRYNIDKIYADQTNEPRFKKLSYGRIIMDELQKIWPEKYYQIFHTNKDCFHCDIIDKKPYDILNELKKEWPVFPDKKMKYKFIQKPSIEQVRIQRLEKKIRKSQARDKKQKEDLKYYKRIVRDFPWIEPEIKSRKENVELKEVLIEKNWALRGVREALNISLLISEKDICNLKILCEDLKIKNNDICLTNDYKETTFLINRIIAIINSLKNHALENHNLIKKEVK